MEKEEVKVPKGQNEKKMSSFITRLVSGIVLLLIMLVIVPAGGMPMFIMMYLISMCGLFELYRVFGIEKKSLGLVGYITVTAYYLLVLTAHSEYFALMTILSLMALMTFYVITYPVSNDIAMQIYELEQQEKGAGLDKDLEILPRDYEGFLATVEAGGLESPFAPGRIRKVVEDLRGHLSW